MRQTFNTVIILIFFIFLLSIICPNNVHCLTIKEEVELSRAFLNIVYDRFEFIDDPAITDYVNKVGQKIVTQLEPQPFDYHFYVINENVYNAFAGPGGHIFINSGLLEVMDSEEELAGILGHEISHVVGRHISKQIEKNKKVALGTLAGVLAGIFIGGQTGGGDAIILTTLAAGESVTLSFSREHEMQADQMGLKYLNKAGYSGEGLIKILRKIKNKQWFGTETVPSYFMTHPLIDSRIGYLDTSIIQNKTKFEKPDPYPFDRAHTILVSQSSDKEKAKNIFQDILKKDPENTLGYLGLGMVNARLNRPQDAIKHLKTALSKKMFDQHILIALGNIYFNEGDFKKAQATFEGALSIDHENTKGLYFLGRTQLALKNHKGAVDTFQALINKDKRYKLASFYMAEAYNGTGNAANSHYHLGIHYLYKKNFTSAVFHINKALEIEKNEETITKLKNLKKRILKKAKNAEIKKREEEEANENQ